MILATISRALEIIGEITCGLALVIPLLYVVIRSDKKDFR